MSKVMMIGFDGADPCVVKQLLDEGRLPNFKKVIENGTTTKDYSMLGVFPSVTPPNWVSLATGNWPNKHGVTDFWNHTLGKDLDITENNWDSRRVESEYIWEAIAKQGKRCIMLNYCQAWPPRFPSDNIVMIDGSGSLPLMQVQIDTQKLFSCEYGDFAAEFEGHKVSNTSSECIVDKEKIMTFGVPQINENADEFEKQFAPLYERQSLIMNDAVFDEMTELKTMGYPVDQAKVPLREAKNWSIELPEKALEAVITLNKGLARRYAVLVTNEDGLYDKVLFYGDRKTEKPLGEAKVGTWSEFIYDEFVYENKKVRVAYKIRVLDMATDGHSCRIFVSAVTNMEDLSYFYPKEMGKKLYKTVGPVMPISTYGRYNREMDLFYMESIKQIFDWHIDTTKFLLKEYPDWQLFYAHIHPQDIINHAFIDRAVPGCDEHWEYYREYIEMAYELEDSYIGSLLEDIDDDTTLFVVSDHAAVPHGPKGSLAKLTNGQGIVVNAMEKLGYTVSIQEEGKMPQIDWSRTKAVMQRGNYVYINLKGRDPHGIVEPEEYDELVENIISDLYNYRDPQTGRRVISFCMTREEMAHINMGGVHCGDIFVQQQPCFIEQHNCAASTCTNAGYSLNNLFMMMGNGVKKGYILDRTVRVPEIVPTICHLMDCDLPKDAEGGVLHQALTR